MSAEDYRLSPELMEEEAAKAAQILGERATGWLKPDGTLQRPAWMDRRRDENGEPLIPSIDDNKPPTQIEAAVNHAPLVAARVQGTIERSKNILAAHAIGQETAALERLRASTSPYVTPTLLARAEAAYAAMERRAEAGREFLREQASNKAVFAEEIQQREAATAAEPPTSALVPSERAKTIAEGYELDHGTHITGKPGALLQLLATETSEFRTLSTSELVARLYPNRPFDKARKALSMLIGITKDNLAEAQAAERLANITVQWRGEGLYILLPPQAGFSNYELSSLIQFVRTKSKDIADLGVQTMTDEYLGELAKQFPIARVGREYIDEAEIERRRDALFAKVQTLLGHPQREKLLPAIQEQNSLVGDIFDYLARIHTALQSAEEKQTLSAFLRRSSETRLIYDIKDHVLRTNGDT